MSTDPTVLLLGGGYTLGRVANDLAATSFIITTRSNDKLENFRSNGFTAELLSVESAKELKQLLLKYPTISTVVDSVPPLRGDGDPLLGVKNIAAAVSASNVSRLVYLSTTGVYGETEGGWVDEDTEPNPKTPWGEQRLQSEEIYRSLEIETISLRIVGIHGPGRGIEEAIRSGRYKLVGDGSKWTNRVHVDTLVRSIIAVINHPTDGTLPKILCVSDGEPARSIDLIEEVCKAEDLPFPTKISYEEAMKEGRYTTLSNQRVSDKLLKQLID